MKVILSENVSNLGNMGATVNVSDGYARNYLIPRKLAVQADSGSARQIEHELRLIRRREEKQRAALMEVAKQVEALTVEIKARAGEDDRIFGSITNANVADRLKELGVDVDRKNVALDDPIKALGIFTVPVRLGSGIEANVKVWVTKEEAE
ncbi:MAG: 50S ribosomal protein L9 [Candidatus Hydrogenedentes bacterium]|nr:50S ribosomal protein L9 [Candidatus Hydrogenedentota bacterium]